MRSWFASYHVFGPPPGGPAQVSRDLGSYRGKAQEEIDHLEASIYLKRGKSYTYPKHPVKPSYLLHVSFSDLESGVQKVGKNSEGLSLGRAEPREETSFSEVGHGLHR